MTSQTPPGGGRGEFHPVRLTPIHKIRFIDAPEHTHFPGHKRIDLDIGQGERIAFDYFPPAKNAGARLEIPFGEEVLEIFGSDPYNNDPRINSTDKGIFRGLRQWSQDDRQRARELLRRIMDAIPTIDDLISVGISQEPLVARDVISYNLRERIK